ncbi:hypothetical protein MMYC01_200435 [Madurella mycetomatis]|uniref:Alkyl hydroperoxide reductase subunit C/ Thiol specific antioxidant domain-containing protein n=1 Tax=Madurella mycetomatis TaxID=100816 RepID=A0A175WGN9_9PEZI|nr:hypothetical protein MMYC01_200435 [Madurella mycetomatis]
MSTATLDPVQQFDHLLGSFAFLFLLYYRGHWCPFCIAHLKELAALSDEIKAAGGTAVAATAEEAPAALANVRSATGFVETVIVDPENVLVAELKRRGLLDVAVSDSQLYRLRGYKHGLAQPALLVVKDPGRLTRLKMNLGGATDRPVLVEVWKNVQKQLQGENSGTEDKYATTGVLHLVGQKIFGR